MYRFWALVTSQPYYKTYQLYDREKCNRAIPAGEHHTRNAKFNRKGTPRWVPVSNATLDKDTLTKAPGTARLTISKTTVTFAGMGVWPRECLKKSVTYVIQRKHPK